METMLESTQTSRDELNPESNLVERISTEFNQLQFYVTKSRGLPLIEHVRPRMIKITQILQHNLEGLFLEGLNTADEEMLTRCLRTYVTIDRVSEAESLFRRNQVHPYMVECISDAYIKQKGGSFAMYARVLEFKNSKCTTLLSVLKNGRDQLKGFDFMVCSVWPEVVELIETQASSIFAPGNPDKFYLEYKDAMEFLLTFESQCDTVQSVDRLREHQTYDKFMSKWNLTVYFQIRLQDIAGRVEQCFLTPWARCSNSTEYSLSLPESTFSNLKRCWSDGVFLHCLSHRFWKLSLQIISRYRTWLHSINSGELEIEVMQDKHIASKPANTSRVDALKSADGKARPSGSSNSGSRSSSPAPPAVEYRKPNATEIVPVVRDTLTLIRQIEDFYNSSIVQLVSPTGEQKSLLDASLQAGIDSLRTELSALLTMISDELIGTCSVQLKQVIDIPRLYRRTNREVPANPSGYSQQTIQILRSFIKEQAKDIPDDTVKKIVEPVVRDLLRQYEEMASDVLSSVRKMEESLKRLKKGKITTSMVGNMSDDDKMRTQISLDFNHMAAELSALGYGIEAEEGYIRLKALINEALANQQN